jgi:hypothetical protein
MYKYAWQQAAEDFFCMRGGHKMEWEIDDKGIHLFIDNHEIDLEAQI